MSDNRQKNRCDVDLRTFVLKKLFHQNKMDLLQRAINMITPSICTKEENINQNNSMEEKKRSDRGGKRKLEPIVFESESKRFRST